MTTAPPLSAADSRVMDYAPRIVFFGPPFSGKTALLHAFVRLACNAESDVEPISTVQDGPTLKRELVPHRVRVEHPDLDPGGIYELIDCDGRAAGELLDHDNPFVRGAARGALVETVRSADALVLVIDATSPAYVVDRTLLDFKRFLDNLEEGRAFGREVGGLPIFLTLTKCDRLSGEGDTPTDWLQRIDERERSLKSKFESVFGTDEPDDDPAPFLPFGSIETTSAATSLEVPPGPGFSAYVDRDGTFGVLGLVASVLPAAKAYDRRVRSAKKRLRWIVTGSAIVLGSMLIAGLVLLAFGQGATPDALTARVQAYEANEGPPAVRLADKNFARNHKELTAIRKAGNFDRLPDRYKNLVEDRLAEFDAYKSYRSQFGSARLGPAEVQSREQLDKLEADLDGPLKPPRPYSQTWADTEAVRLRDKWSQDLGLVRDAVERLHAWYTNPASIKMGLIPQGFRLLSIATPPDAAWRESITKLLDHAEKPPFKTTDPIHESKDVPGLRGRRLTHAVAHSFDRNVRAGREWNDLARQLRYLRDFADALALTTPTGVLANSGGSVSLESATAILLKLREAYPPSQYPNADYPEWSVVNLPEALRGHLSRRLVEVREAGERLLKNQLSAIPGGDSEAGWAAVRTTLSIDSRYRDWGRLLHLLARWVDPEADDPVRQLTTYLLRDKFELDLRTVNVTVPDDLVEPPIVAANSLTITLRPRIGAPQEYKYRVEGSPERKRPLTTYSFVPVGHSGRIEYLPGDGLTATASVRSERQDYGLVWSAGRSAWYQIDNLVQPPRIEKAGSNPDPATGVRLSVPNASLSAPVLFPNRANP